MLCNLYRQLNLTNLKAIRTNQHIVLMVAICKIFPYIVNLLYLWHINKYVKGNGTKLFRILKIQKKNEKNFMKSKRILYMPKLKKHRL